MQTSPRVLPCNLRKASVLQAFPSSLSNFYFSPSLALVRAFRKLFLFVKREFRQLWARRALIAR
jgi:hypothetical protein